MVVSLKVEDYALARGGASMRGLCLCLFFWVGVLVFWVGGCGMAVCCCCCCGGGGDLDEKKTNLLVKCKRWYVIVQTSE